MPTFTVYLTRFFLLATLFTISASEKGNAQTSADSVTRPLPLELPVLKNRLKMSFPAEATNQPRPHDILSPAPAEDQETRITYTLGKQRMVVFVQEMNALATLHLLEDVVSLYTPAERLDYGFGEIKTSGGFRAVLTTPLRRDSSQEAILIRSVLIQMADSTLIQAGVYLNPSAYEDLPKFLTLSEAILRSACPGNRKQVLTARTEKVPVLGSPDSLLLQVPAKYVILKSLGFDFITYQIRRLESLTIHAQGGIIVYTGLHPTSLKDSYQFSSDSRKEKKGRLWGKDIQWDSYADKTKGFFLLEHMLQAEVYAPGLQIHTAVVAKNERELDTLRHIVEAMSISKLN
jgi:hypothetical protein